MTPCGPRTLRRSSMPSEPAQDGIPTQLPDIGHLHHLPRVDVLVRNCGLTETNDADAYRCENCLRAITSVEFLVDRCQVVLHRFAADEELHGHLGRAQTVGD